MATSSITKQFFVHDTKAYEQMIKDLENQPKKTTNKNKKSSLQRGKEKLVQLSSH